MQTNAVNAQVGRKVADFRKAHGWSQQKLADLLSVELGKHVDGTTVTRLEQGARPIPVHELVALAHVLGVEQSALMPDDVSGHRDPARMRVDAARLRVESARARSSSVRAYAEEVARRAASTEQEAAIELAEAERALTEALRGQPVTTDDGVVWQVWDPPPGQDATAPADDDAAQPVEAAKEGSHHGER